MLFENNPPTGIITSMRQLLLLSRKAAVHCAVPLAIVSILAGVTLNSAIPSFAAPSLVVQRVVPPLAILLACLVYVFRIGIIQTETLWADINEGGLLFVRDLGGSVLDILLPRVATAALVIPVFSVVTMVLVLAGISPAAALLRETHPSVPHKIYGAVPLAFTKAMGIGLAVGMASIITPFVTTSRTPGRAASWFTLLVMGLLVITWL